MAYASPAIPIAAMGLPISVYIPPFYAQDLGLGLAVVGTVFMLARIWDVITDPILGVVSDRFPTRWGRRRHWIVISVPIMLLATWQLFMPDPEQVSALYLMLWMLLLYIAWTLLTISHMSWGAELSPHYHERSRVQGTREIALLIGAIMVLGLPAVIEQMQPDNLGAARVASMGWMIIILLPITVLWAVTKVGESENHSATEISWLDTVNVIKNNAAMQRLLLCDLFSGISGGTTAALFLFFAADVLQLGSGSSIVLLLYFFSGIFFVPLFVSLSNKVGKHITLCFSSVVHAISINVIWFLPTGAPVAAAAAMVLLGINMGAPSFLLRSMMADVADEDTATNGKQRTGLFYSLLTMTSKVGGAAAIGVAYGALDLMGFIPGGENSDATLLGFEILFIVPVIVLNIFIAVIIYRFPIDQTRQEHNRRLIDAHQTTVQQSSGAEDYRPTAT